MVMIYAIDLMGQSALRLEQENHVRVHASNNARQPVKLIGSARKGTTRTIFRLMDSLTGDRSKSRTDVAPRQLFCCEFVRSPLMPDRNATRSAGRTSGERPIYPEQTDRWHSIGSLPARRSHPSPSRRGSARNAWLGRYKTLARDGTGRVGQVVRPDAIR
jgi:hypothetical protein